MDQVTNLCQNIVQQRDGYYSKLEAKDDHYKDYSLLPEFRSYSDRSKYSPSYYADDQFADFPGGSAHDLRSAYARRGFVSTNLIPSAYTQGYIRARILSPTYVRRGYLRTHIMSPYRRGFFETNAASPAYARRGFLGTKAGLMGSSSFARRGFLSSNVMQPYLPYRRGLLKDNMMSPYYTRRELLRSEIDSPYYVTGLVRINVVPILLRQMIYQ